MAETVLAPSRYRHAAHIDRRIVWITSFPKSGNTWARILLANFLGDGKEGTEEEEIALVGSISGDRIIFDNATGLSSSDLTPREIDLLRPAAYRQIAGIERQAPLFIKAHDAFQLNAAGESIFPADCTRGAILLVRHPMDVAPSLAHHLGHADCEDTVRRLGSKRHMLAGDARRQFHQRTKGWSGHYLSWTRQDAIPVLVVRYEDLLADPSGQLGAMLGFLGIPGAEDGERIGRAVALSRFDRLQAIERNSGFDEISIKAERFFRSGRAGEGIEQLPAHLKQRILEDHAPVMAELGYSERGAHPL